LVLVVEYFQMLALAILVGKVVLLSFIVAPILAKNLERDPFGKVVRQLFPAITHWAWERPSWDWSP